MPDLQRFRPGEVQVTHGIPCHVRNSTLEQCIAEYVRRERDQQMLRAHWFEGRSLMGLAEDWGMSLTGVKKIIYGIGDPILLRAARMDE